MGKGLYCDMNAIRRDEELDNLHSVYVDQWDWEKIITVEDRNETYLKKRGALHRVCGVRHRDEPARHVPPNCRSCPCTPPT